MCLISRFRWNEQFKQNSICTSGNYETSLPKSFPVSLRNLLLRKQNKRFYFLWLHKTSVISYFHTKHSRVKNVRIYFYFIIFNNCFYFLLFSSSSSSFFSFQVRTKYCFRPCNCISLQLSWIFWKSSTWMTWEPNKNTSWRFPKRFFNCM